MAESDDPAAATAPTPEAHGHHREPAAQDGRAGRDEADVADRGARASAGDPTGETDPEMNARRGAVKGRIEALFMAADDPIDAAVIGACLPEVDADQIKRVLQSLRLEYSGSARGIHLVEVAGGLQFRTNPDFKDVVLQMYETRPRALSRAALETLAIVAYQQPVTRAGVEEIRGVDSSGVIRTLADHALVETIGRLDDLGRPHIYGTTPRFLEFFGLDTLSDLPTLDADELAAIEEMYADELAAADQADQADQSPDTSTGQES